MESMPKHTNIFILRMTESYPRVLVTICIGGVAKGVKGVGKYFIQIQCDILYDCISDIAVSKTKL